MQDQKLLSSILENVYVQNQGNLDCSSEWRNSVIQGHETIQGMLTVIHLVKLKKKSYKVDRVRNMDWVKIKLFE